MACPLAVPCLAGQFIKSLTRIRNSVVFKTKEQISRNTTKPNTADN